MLKCASCTWEPHGQPVGISAETSSKMNKYVKASRYAVVLILKVIGCECCTRYKMHHGLVDHGFIQVANTEHMHIKPGHSLRCVISRVYSDTLCIGISHGQSKYVISLLKRTFVKKYQYF